MPLESFTLEIVANGGLAEDVNPRILQQGSWLGLDNVALDKTGAFKKRNGYQELSTYKVDFLIAPLFSSTLHLGTVGDTLYQILAEQRNPSAAAPTRGPALCVQDLLGGWTPKDDVSPFLLRREVGLRSHREFNGGAVVHSGNERYTLGCLYNDDPAKPGGLPIILRGVDVDTGAVVQDDLIVGYLSPGLSYLQGYTMKCAAIGRYVVAAHNRTGGVSLTIYDTVARTFGTVQVVASVALGLSKPSVWKGSDDTIIVAYNDGSTLKVREWRIYSSTVATALAASYSLTESGRIDELEVCTDDNAPTNGNTATRVFVTYTVNTSESVGVTKTLALTRSTLVLTWGPFVLDAQQWTFVTNVFAGQRLWSVGRDQPTGNLDTALIYVAQTGTDGLALSEQKLASGLTPAGRPFCYEQRAYLPVLANGTGGGGTPYTGAIVELKISLNADGTPSGEPAPLVATFAVECWGTFQFGGYFTASQPSQYGDICFAAPVFTGVAATGIDIVRLTPIEKTWALPTTTAQGLAVIPGALTSYFDGQGVFEAGFLEPPIILRSTTTLTTGALTAGTYLYVAAWLYEDAAGNQHWSQPSAPFSRIIPDLAYQVNLEISTDRIGRRDRDVDGQEREVRLIVFRTKKNESSPFYRLNTPTVENLASTGTYKGPTSNKRFEKQIAFSDKMPDGLVVLSGYGLLTFDLSGNGAGVLDCDPPPPSLFALNHKNRLWLVSGDNPRSVWFSREFKQNEAPCFSQVLQFSINDTTEEITALAPMGDKILVFTKNRIYFVSGDGPDDTGQGGLPFQGPYLVSDTIGCSAPKSVASYEGGVLFAQRYGRFPDDPYDVSVFQINSALQIARISGPVEDTLKDFNVFCGTWADPARGLVGFGLRRGTYNDETDPSVHLIWSFWKNAWVRWTTPNVRVSASHLHRGDHVWSATNDWFANGFHVGNVYREQRNFFEDPKYINAAQWITMRVQTPWLRAGAIAGYGRTRQVQVLGESPDGYLCNLSVALDYDYRETGGSTHVFPITSLSHRTFPSARVGAVPSVQKSQSIRVTVSDGPYPAASLGAGVTISAISLEIAGKKGLSKLARTSRGRDGV